MRKKTRLEALTNHGGLWMADVFPSISVLIPELKLGDPDAWNDLCNSFRQGLVAKTRKFLTSAKLEKRWSADDLVQETFMKAWKQHHSFRGRTTSQFAKWMLIILQNTYLDLIRRTDLEISTPTLMEFCAHGDTPSAQFLLVEHEAVLHASLAELDPQSREIMLLRHFEDLKLSEVASRTGLNVNTVASICRRSLLKLADLMEYYEEQALLGLPE